MPRHPPILSASGNDAAPILELGHRELTMAEGRKGRQFSVLSQGALNTLDNLTEEINGALAPFPPRDPATRAERAPPGLEARIAELETLAKGSASTDAEKETRLNALGEIRQIIGNLDKIQSTKVDAVRAVRAAARAHGRRAVGVHRGAAQRQGRRQGASVLCFSSGPSARHSRARGATRRTRGRA